MKNIDSNCRCKPYKGWIHKRFGLPIPDEWFYAFVITYMSFACLAEANKHSADERLCRYHSDYRIYIPEPITNPPYLCIDGKMMRILK